MKLTPFIQLVGLGLALLFWPQSLLAQNYKLDWSTISSGGVGASTGAVFSMSGTIGQSDAGVLRGGRYTVIGGFWGVVTAIQTPGAPLLTITRDLGTGAIIVSWDAPAAGFVIDQTLTFTGSPGAPWSQIGLPYQTNAGRIFISTPSQVGNRFYRLRKP